MKLEKFDLEKALNGAKVFTRGGYEVTELNKFQSINKWNLYGVIDNEVHCWDQEGVHKDSYSNIYDLCIAVEPKRVWVNVYRTHNGGLYTGFDWYDSKELAVRCKGARVPEYYIKTIEITDEL